MKTNFVFDIDGTLTEPRKMMTPSFESYFYKWMRFKKVYLVTGSDMDKVREQVSDRILDNCAGIFHSMGNELLIDNVVVYQNTLNLPPELIKWLEQELAQSPYPIKRTNNFEYRIGMLNYSIAGRDSNMEERKQYYEWDQQSGERRRIADWINQNYNGRIEAFVGGQISIDIQNTGNNKSLASKWIRKYVGGPMIFFGDKTEIGGNDRAIVDDILNAGDGKYFQVHGPSHLKIILEE